MISSFDNSNDNNDQSSKNLNKLNVTKKNSSPNNNINSENYIFNMKNNTINDFYSHKDLSVNDNKIFFTKTLKVINPNINKTLENKDLDGNNNNNTTNNLSPLIKELNFNNLNEYYEIQSSIFMKKIQKLNLKFYWTTEVFLNDKNIEYPYNKLFLILFKEISLYIDEIERLNKQLKLKTKNEKYYTQKIIQMDQKEKNNMINKQTIANTTLDSLNTPNSLILNNSSKTSKKISKKLMNKKNNNEIKEIIKNGIEECDEELKNLTKIEELLLAKKTKIFPRYYSRKKEKYKYINKTLK